MKQMIELLDNNPNQSGVIIAVSESCQYLTGKPYEHFKESLGIQGDNHPPQFVKITPEQLDKLKQIELDDVLEFDEEMRTFLINTLETTEASLVFLIFEKYEHSNISTAIITNLIINKMLPSHIVDLIELFQK